MEIRGWGKLGNPTQFGLREHPYFLTHSIDITGDLQDIRKNMSRNVRYNLRYAEKTPVKLWLGQDENDLKKFHRLSSITRKRLNLLPQPYRFFQSIYNHVIIPGHGYILFAELDNNIIAANIYFCFNKMVLHEFAAQDSHYMEHRPNYLLIWNAIERAFEGSYRCYNFGRTQPENQPLAKFKRQWGSEEVILPYYYYPTVRGLSSLSQSSFIYRTYSAMNKRLPSFILNIGQRFIQKHMG